MLRKKSAIAFTEDILGQVALEMDLELDKVEFAYENMIGYLRVLTNETNAVTIYFPHLGTFHTKLKYINHKLASTFKGKTKDLKLYNIFLKKRDRINEYLFWYNNNNPKNPLRHTQPLRYNMYTYKYNQVYSEMEESQNSVIEI